MLVKKYPLIVALVTIVFLFVLGAPVSAMPNPSAVYCTALGYQYSDKIAPDGGMTGFCILPDNQAVDSWEFYFGNTGKDFSYCKKQGYDIRMSNDPSLCDNLMTIPCAVCVKPDGSEIELTKAMNLSLKEEVYPVSCGNNQCDSNENADNCPNDCSSAQISANSLILIILIGLITICLISGGWYFLKKKKPAQK
jgi:putative hemolysin